MGFGLCERELEGIVAMLTQEGTGCIPGLECGQMPDPAPGGNARGILISKSPVDKNVILCRIAGAGSITPECYSDTRRPNASTSAFMPRRTRSPARRNYPIRFRS